MKDIFKENMWLTGFIFLCITFLFYTAIKTGTCIEIDNKSFRAGTCQISE